MAQQTINLGTIADDGTGDTLRDGGDKINDNFTELYTDKLNKSGGTMTGDLVVPDEAYDATAWNGSLEVPTKNAVRDKIESLGSGITELDDVPDVNAPTPSNGDVLTWDSTPGEWVNAPAGSSIAELDDVPDVNAPTPSNGDVLTWDSTPGEWVAAAPSGGGALDDLTDVDAAAPADGDVLTFDSGSGDWVPTAPSGGSTFGGAWTDITFASSESRYGQTVYPSNETVALVAGKALEIEIYLYRNNSSTVGFWTGIDGTNAYQMYVQNDNNITVNRFNGASGTLIQAMGAEAGRSYLGVHFCKMVVNCEAASDNYIHIEWEGQRNPTNSKHANTTFTTIGNMKLWVMTDDITKCLARMRVAG